MRAPEPYEVEAAARSACELRAQVERLDPANVAKPVPYADVNTTTPVANMLAAGHGHHLPSSLDVRDELDCQHCGAAPGTEHALGCRTRQGPPEQRPVGVAAIGERDEEGARAEYLRLRDELNAERATLTSEERWAYLETMDAVLNRRVQLQDERLAETVFDRAPGVEAAREVAGEWCPRCGNDAPVLASLPADLVRIGGHGITCHDCAEALASAAISASRTTATLLPS